jgi:hypothetical protein
MIIKVDPLDTLFFRDGKPFSMGSDSWANSVFPPYPSVFYGALRSTYFSEHIHELKMANTPGDPTKNLKITGIYFLIQDEIYLPLPYDCVQEKDTSNESAFCLPLVSQGEVKTSSPVHHYLKSKTPLKKIKRGLIPITSLKEYLSGTGSEIPFCKIPDCVMIEPKIGISINRETGLVLGKTSHTTWLDRQGEGLESQDKKEEKGPFDILLAMEDVGLGRAVFFGGALSFWNSVTMEEHNNIDLFINAITWLGEPGGPYKQYLPLNEQAQTFLEEGMSLYDTHAFSEAQEQLLTACSLSEQSHDVYPHADSLRILEKAQSYIALCERGLEAETLFETAQTSFENREYETAIETYEAALAIYTEIVYSERSEECNKQIEECKRLISLRDQAESLYTQAEEHLNRESGMFDTVGYQEARSLFEQSMEKWEAYGDPDKVTDCEEKIICFPFFHGLLE